MVIVQSLVEASFANWLKRFNFNLWITKPANKFSFLRHISLSGHSFYFGLSEMFVIWKFALKVTTGCDIIATPLALIVL